MASKKQLDNAVIAQEYKPCLYLDVPSKEMLDDLKLGEQVEIIIRGRVKGLSSSKRVGPDGKSEHNSLDVEDYKIKIAGKSVWDELGEDDDD